MFRPRPHLTWGIRVALTAAIGLCTVFTLRLRQTNDSLAYLAERDGSVHFFRNVMRRHGALDLALIGIETADVLAPPFLARLAAATRELRSTEGVGSVLSVTNVEAIITDSERGGVRVEYLIPRNPSSAAESSELAERLLAHEDVIRDLVARDRQATVILVTPAPGSDATRVAERARRIVSAALPDDTKVWAGAPFIAGYVADATRADLSRFALPVGIGLLLALGIALRRPRRLALTLLPALLGVVVSLGAMAWLDVALSPVLGMVPLLVVIIASTAGVAGVAVLAAFWTVAPEVLRPVWAFAAVGVLAAAAIAAAFGSAGRWRAASGARIFIGHRAWAGFGLLVLAAMAVGPAGRLHGRLASAFPDGSLPAEADRFFARHFGGSAVLTVDVAADLSDPAVLRVVSGIADRLAGMPGVASVAHIGDVLALVNESLSGERRLPDTAAKARLLYGFLEGKQVVRQLVTDERNAAVLQVRLRTDRPDEVARTISAVRRLLSEPPLSAAGAVVARVGALWAGAGLALEPGLLVQLEAALRRGHALVPTTAVAATLERYLHSDEFLGDVPAEPPDAPRRIAEAAAGVGPNATIDRLTIALTALPLDADGAAALAGDVLRPLREIWSRERARAWAVELAAAVQLPIPDGPRGRRLLAGLADALIDLERADPASGAADLAVRMTGVPIVDEQLGARLCTAQRLGAALAVLALALVAGWREWVSRRRSSSRTHWPVVRAASATLLAAVAAALLWHAALELLGAALDVGTAPLAAIAISVAATAWRVVPARVAVALAVGIAPLALGSSPVGLVGKLALLALVLGVVAALVLSILHPSERSE